MPKYLDELNDPQREAVLHKDGPIMIIAGAGSGKNQSTYHENYSLNGASQCGCF